MIHLSIYQYNPIFISYSSPVLQHPTAETMKQTHRIQFLFNQRMQFLESLFLLSSYQELISINTAELAQTHKKLEKQQTETVSTILSSVRVDDIFKKQFHTILIKVFHKIEPRITMRKVPTGTYKEIIFDYTIFFTQLKEKHILDFLKQIFQFQIYNQTTVIYVLLELMFKFLRIKCLSFITDRIQPKNTAASLNRFSYLMLNQSNKHDSKNKQTQRRRNTSSPLSRTTKNRLKSSLDHDKMPTDVIQINSKTISFTGPHQKQRYRMSSNRLKSADLKKNLNYSPRQHSASQQSKRRVIKSYKDIREQTKSKIEKNNQNLITIAKGWAATSSQGYYRMFTKVFEKEWRDYMLLTGLENPTELDDEASQKSPEINFSTKKKNEWLSKNSDKVAVEACSRNDDIRKQMEIYTEQFSSRFKK